MWCAGRGLITTLSWNIEQTAKTCVFEAVRTVAATSPFGGSGVAFPHFATPNHEGALNISGVRCRAVFFAFLGGARPTPCAIGPPAQLNHKGGPAVTFSGEQNPLRNARNRGVFPRGFAQLKHGGGLAV